MPKYPFCATFLSKIPFLCDFPKFSNGNAEYSECMSNNFILLFKLGNETACFNFLVRDNFYPHLIFSIDINFKKKYRTQKRLIFLTVFFSYEGRKLKPDKTSILNAKHIKQILGNSR